MAKRIKFSQKAYTDIDKIVEFNNIRNRSNTYSQKFIIKLNERLMQLIAQPLSGMPADTSGLFILVWDDDYIFYRLEETYIEYHPSTTKKKTSPANLTPNPPQSLSSLLPGQLAS